MTLTGFEVSVVIPAYNAAHTLGRALDSVLRQSLPASQILVVNDGSRDDLTTLEHRYAGRVQWIHQINQGAAAARNTGIDHAQHPLVAFLDADDYWQPNKLEMQVACYRQNPELGLTYSTFCERRPGEPPIPVRRPFRYRRILDQPHRPRDHEIFDVACLVWTGTVMVPRSLLATHRFESGLEPAEDRDLWVRLLQLAPTYCHAKPLATAVLEAGSLSRTQLDRDCANMLRVIQRAGPLLGRRGAHDGGEPVRTAVGPPSIWGRGGERRRYRRPGVDSFSSLGPRRPGGLWARACRLPRGLNPAGH